MFFPLIRFNRRYKYNTSFDWSFKFVNDIKKPFLSYREFQYFRLRNKFKDKKHRLYENMDYTNVLRQIFFLNR